MSQSRHPILANLKPDPANIQSSKQLVSKKTNATSSCAKNSVKASSSVSSVKTADKTSNVQCLMPSNRHDSTLSGRMRKKVHEEQNSAFLQHPHSIKLRTRKRKLSELLVKIFNLADTDTIVCDAESGLNDYSKNLKFADELDDISKHLVSLSQECCEKANAIRQKVADAKEDKRLIQDIVHLHDVIKESEKDPFVAERNKDPINWVNTNEFRVKRENTRTVTLWESSDDEEDNQKLPGDPDTKFKFPKQNENDEIRFSQHICVECDKTLQDSYELCNHMSKHHKELYRCVKCPEDIFRTEASYEQHCRTHMGIMFKCSDCAAVFDRKSTLTNHAFTHTKSLLTCQKCGKQFKFRSTYLEHIT